VKRDEQIDFLNKFRWVDKYATFSKVLPLAIFTPASEKDQVTDILDACCKNLVTILKQEPKPGKITIRQTITGYMDELARAGICQVNKDFGYELFWYLGEKMGIDLKKASHSKIWGYWKVESNSVITVTSVRKRKTAEQQA
jgi:hypothetical protein